MAEREQTPFVMAGLGPAIHEFFSLREKEKAWMARTSRAMTVKSMADGSVGALGAAVNGKDYRL